MKDARGFTLVELVVVITVLSILTAMSAPSFRNMVANARLQSLASDLQAAMMLARSEAIKRSDTITLNTITAKWQDGWRLVDTRNQLVREFDGQPGLLVSANVNSVVFQGNGRLANLAATPQFQVTDQAEVGDPRCVRLDRSGRAYVVRKEC